MSAQLKKLESQAGTVLFRKAGRGLELTEAGETLLAYAHRMLELNEEAGAALRGVEPSAFGEVNATFNTVRNLGGGLGVAIVVALLGNQQPIPFDRFDHTYYAMAFLGIVPVVVVALCYPRR